MSSGSTKHNIFLAACAGLALKLEKVDATFSSSNPLPSVASVATDGRKYFQCLNNSTVLNNKTGHLVLEFNYCEDKFWHFKAKENCVTETL